MRASQLLTGLGAALAVFLGAAATPSAQMPDARQMSGIPMPTSDVPAGSVSVRLVRGELTNNIAGHPVELHAGARTDRATTDQDGRAVFSGVPPGTSVHAMAEVDGQRLESQSFTLPPDAGVRLVLVAGAAGGPVAAPATAPAAVAPGDVALGGDSRIQIEFDDDTLEVFYLLDLVNPSSAPVTPARELVFELPAGAQQAAALEGSSPQATVRGRTVSITGPIAPGATPIRLAYSLAPAGSDRTLAQTLPAAWTQVQVIMTRAGGARMSSPQFASATDMAGGDGQAFILGTGPALAAGQEFSVALSGLPSRSHLGRNLSLGVAILLLLAGAWAAASARSNSGEASRRTALVERRDRLMADLVRLEEQRRAGTVDERRHASRHEELVTQLERVYGELDRQPGAAAEV